MSDQTMLAKGRFLSLVSRNGWEFTTRTNATGVVAVVAVTDRDEIVLVEQHRPPVGGPVIEIPAGLVGDDPLTQSEAAIEAAQRELLEETGFEAVALKHAGRFVSSAGLTDEAVDFYVTRSIHRKGAGGGVGNERIQVHTVPLHQVHAWLTDKMRLGIQVDSKVLSGLLLLQAYRHEQN